MRFAAVLLMAAAAFAQNYRGRVQGTVTDSSAAVVAGAKVALLDVNKGIETVRETSASGQFLFDFVDPGTYTLSAELQGFNKYTQQNILVQVRSDVSVNPVLRPGNMVETVDVSSQAAEVQFNTGTMALTVDRKMLTDLPVLARNPFTLALLDPAVVNRYATLATRNPFYMWSSSSMDVGGNTTTKNELQLDGAPLQLGAKGSYAPPMDATQEVSVQQNAVDAEFGHSAGGVLSLSVKSGTNEFHGTGYYFGRNPAFNAVTNSVVRSPNAVKNHIWGGTIGNPIIKNKLFNFFSYEQWRTKDPRNAIMTLPTDLERGGNFSQSFNPDGGLRAIFDPFTTQLNAAANSATRTPFPGNQIPRAQMDPLSLRFMQDIWGPNTPGEGITRVNNYKQSYFWYLNNWNVNNRTDWNINDQWKVFGRYSRFRTDLAQDNYSPNTSPALTDDNGGVMNSRNIAGDAVWTASSRTVVNFRFSYASLNDDYEAPKSKIGADGLAKFWPIGWYKPYLEGIPSVYYPNLSISGVGGASFGKGGYWYQHPESFNYSGRVSRNFGRHYVKWGAEARHLRGSSVRPNLMNFSFGPALTADTFLAPNTRLRGDAWATFLLGAIDSSSQAQYIPLQKPRTDFFAGYMHDDFKVNRNLTINLGLRWEYETGIYDAEDRFSRALDLKNPIPEMQANPPAIPADIAALRGKPYSFTGAWNFVGNGNPRSSFDSPKKVFMPRIGMAYRLSDRMSLRVGYARYVIPAVFTTDLLGSASYPGYNALSTAAPVLQGVPQAKLSDPFPSTNPLIPQVGSRLGRHTNLGQAASWQQREYRPGVNERINVSFQRQLPGQIHFDITYFVNLGRDLPYNLQLNLVDPALIYSQKAALDQTVTNPFFQYLTPDKFPGQLRNQRTVTRRSLLSTYPQYGGLTQTNSDGFLNRYHAIQVKAQRSFRGGLFFLVAYNFNRERNSYFFNDIAEFGRQTDMLDSNNPRHRISQAGSYELPFGKGRKWLANSGRATNLALGGWSASWLMFYNSGAFLRFPSQVAPAGTPQAPRERGKWFDTTGFDRQPAFTPRSNPFQYNDLAGPRNWNLDTTLSKFFQVTERFKLELRFEAYNLTNSFVPNDPATAFTSATFGRTTNQINRGREMQYTMRVHF